MRSALGLALLLAALAAGEPACNVVVIVGDDHGWSDNGFMGHPVLKTPQLDRLAREGLCYTRGYVAAPLCRPSLASIATGRHVFQHRITGNDPGAQVPGADAAARRQAMVGAFQQLPSLGTLFAGAGAATFQSGKWWEGSFKDGGFAEGLTQGQRHGDKGLVIGRATMQPAFDFIDRCGGRPFLLWYAPMLPHTPHDPPPRLLAAYAAPGRSEALVKYWANIARFDESVGQLLDHLEARGLARRTLVVWLSDNGWHQDERMPDTPKSGTRHGKQTPYDLGVRTPIVLRRPGTIAPRREDSALAHAVDVLPTALAMAGLAPPAGLPGIDLLDPSAVAARRSVAGGWWTHDCASLADPTQGLQGRWLVAGMRKLIAHQDGRSELYDLAADPAETKDLAAADPDAVARLRAELDAWWPAGRASNPPP